MKKQCYLYYINTHSRIKIGVSECPDRRLANLRSSSPFHMEIVGLESYPTKYAARKREVILHAKFEYLRIHGEWFDLDRELARVIGESLLILRGELDIRLENDALRQRLGTLNSQYLKLRDREKIRIGKRRERDLARARAKKVREAELPSETDEARLVRLRKGLKS